MNRFRLGRANEVLKNENLDAMLLTSFDNIRYVTDCRIYFTTTTLYNSYFAIVLPGKFPQIQGPAIEARYSSFAANVKGWSGYPLVTTNGMSSRWSSMVSSLFRENGVKSGRVGIDDISFISYLELTKRLPKIQFVPIYNQMLEARSIKSADEVSLIKRAAGVVDAGAEAAFEYTRVGVKERDIVSEMSRAMLRQGSEAEPWAASLTSGKRTLDSIFATDKLVEDGDYVVFDIGAIFEGYLGDTARTVAAGNPPREARRLYTAVYDALGAGVDSVRPGIRSSRVNERVRETILGSGYDASFFCSVSTGHGVGTNAPELPWLCAKEESLLDQELKPGMVLAIEPRAASPGLTAAACEDMVLVTDGGHEVLTRSSKQEHLLLQR